MRYLTQTWAASEGGWHFRAGCAPVIVDSIQCDGCEAWMHSQCIDMAYGTYATYSIMDHYKFFCCHCTIAASGCINYAAMMSRIASRAPDVRAMREQAQSEQQLLRFYRDTLPDVCPPTRASVSVDQPSVDLLKHRCAWLLQQYTPASVAGDGNCLFRAVSLALFGHKSAYCQLRLLTAIEVLTHRAFYDTTSDQFSAPYSAGGVAQW